MIVYVLYSDYGSDEGCDAPSAVVTSEEEVALWVAKCPEFNTAAEFDIKGTFWELPAE